MKKKVQWSVKKVTQVFLVALLALPLTALMNLKPVYAATSITVNSTTDSPGSGTCLDGTVTLREAFGTADGCVNDSSGRDTAYTVTLGSGTYVTSEALVADAGASVTLAGVSSSATIVTGTGSGPAGGALAFSGGAQNVSISNLRWNQTGGQSVFKVADTTTGDISVSGVIINTTGDMGVWVGDDGADAFTVTGNVSVTGSTITAVDTGIHIGPHSGSVVSPLHVTGTLTVTGNTVTIDAAGSDRGAISINCAYSTGAATISTNTITVGNNGEASRGIAVVDNFDTGALFGSSLTIQTNGITSSGSDAIGDGIGVYERATGTTLIDDNTITIKSDATANGSPVSVADSSCFGPGSCLGIGAATISDNTITATMTGAGANAVFALLETGIVRGNTITLSDGAGGIASAGGVICSSFATAVDCNVSANRITGFSDFGIATIAVAPSQTVTSHIFNNVVYGGRGPNVGGIFAGTMDMGGGDPDDATINADVYNNTVYDVRTGTGASTNTGAIIASADDSVSGTDHVSVEAVDNILKGNGNGFLLTKVGGSEDVTITSDYNIVNANTADAGSNYNGISAGTNDLTTDPAFTSAGTGDFTIPLTSPAYNAAVAASYTAPTPDLTTPTVDIIGTSRPQRTTNDIGAYEYINQAPTAGAGIDQSKFVTETVTLHCASTDAESDTIGYSWSRTSGPSSVSFTGGSTADASFTASAAGTYVIRCTTSDSFGGTSNDSMSVVVTLNASPVPNAGVDQDVTVGDTVNIHCTSTDADAGTAVYQWTTASGPDTPVFPEGADQSFAASDVGTYVMICSTQDEYASPAATDSVSIVVHSANAAPVANAGSDQTNITVGAAVSLTCTSTDADLDTVTYSWAQSSGPSATLTSTNTAATGFTPSAVGTYVMECTADDGTDTDADTVSVVVNAHRLSGADRYATPVAISQQQFADNSATSLVVATGTNFPDSLAAGPLASLVGGPILLVQPTALPSGVATEILRVLDTSSAATVYIAGGTGAVSSSVSTAIAGLDAHITVVRLSGADRYATSLAIAQRMDTIRGSGPVKIAVATGAGFADAAAISSPASNATVAAGRMPILLTNTNELPSSISSYISSKSGTITKVYIPGGTAVVSSAVRSAIGDIVGSSNVTRLSGSDRYSTAAAIATEFYGDSNAPTKVAVGTGSNFPDLLAGGPNAGAANMPILYNNGSTLPTATSTYISGHSATLNYVYLYGGSAVVPDAIKTAIQALL